MRKGCTGWIRSSCFGFLSVAFFAYRLNYYDARLLEQRNGAFLVLHVVRAYDDQVAFFGDEYL